MVKAYNQVIPSEYYHNYRKALIKLRFTGFDYYIDEYNYGYVGLVQTRVKPRHLSLRGFDVPRQSSATAIARRIFHIWAPWK